MFDNSVTAIVIQPTDIAERAGLETIVVIRAMADGTLPIYQDGRGELLLPMEPAVQWASDISGISVKDLMED